MTTIQILLFFHILGSFMIAAGAGLGEVTLAGMRRSRSTTAILALANAGSRVPMLTITGALITIITGSWLVSVTGQSFGAPWVSVTYLVWILSMALSAAILGPAETKLHALAVSENAAGREESPALIAAVADMKVMITTHVLSLMVIVFIALMVFKPGA